MVTVAHLYIILIISNFAPFFSLSSPSTQPTPLPLIHTLPQTKSKINHKINNKTTHRHHKTKHTHTRTHQWRQRGVDRRLWRIGVLGSECLDQRSSHRDWIGVLLAVLGLEFQIGIVLRLEFQMEISDRRLNFRWKFQLGLKFQISVVLPAWIEISESLE